MAVAFGIALATATAHAQVDYFYDEAGRLVGVVAQNGEAAQYVYDAAGNIVEIKRFAAGQLAVIEFTPNRGPIGTAVTIFGSGFSATPASNTVKFNGVTASVTSAATTRLVATVPAGATTGRISVTVGANTATSHTDFVVGANPLAPVITSFAPTIATFGTAITVTGRNYDATPINNVLRINGIFAPVSSGNATTLNSAVPSAATSGKLQVTTQHGTATSSADLFIPPPPLVAADVAATGRAVLNGASPSLSIAQAGKVGLVIFDATAGANIGIGMTGLTMTGSNYVFSKVYRPDWTEIGYFYCYTNGDTCELDLANLPATGTYTIVVQPPAGSTASVTVHASTDLTASLSPNTARNVNVTRPGQNQRLTFNATVNQLVALEVAGITTNPAGQGLQGVIYRQDGTWVSNVYIAAGITFVWNPPATGSYTLFLEPTKNTATSAATFTARVTLETGTAITVNGPGVNGTVATTWESARFNFTATAGQNLGIGMTNLVLSGTGSTYAFTRIYRPDGVELNSFYCYPSGNTCELDLANLPMSGTYVMIVQPQAGGTGTFTMHVSTDLTAALTPDFPVNVNVARPGQNQRLTFNATAGQPLSIEVAAVTTNPAGQGLSGQIFRQDGSWAANAYIGGGNTILWNPPATGTYTLFLEPSTNTATSAATFTARVTLETGTTITVDGAGVNGTVATTGETARFNFTGTAGQKLGIGMTNLVLSGAGSTYVYARIYKPDGVELTGFYCYPNGNTCSVNIANLPVSGIYAIIVQPQAGGTGTFTLHASTDLSATLTPNTPYNVNVTRPGQNQRLTFDATLNQLVTLEVAGLVTNPAGQGMAGAIQRQDGTWVANVWLGAGGTHVFNPPATATYVLFLEPSTNTATTAATFTARVTLDTGTPLTIDGASANGTVATAWESARFNVSGTAGQQLGIGMTNLVLSTGSSYAYTTIYKPDGTSLTSFYCYPNGSNCSVNVANLPSTGTYVMVVQPYLGGTGTFTLHASTDLNATLTPNTPYNVNVTRPGQNQRLTFDATLNQLVTLEVAGLVTNPAGQGMAGAIQRQDGTWVANVWLGAGGTHVFSPPATATYVLFLEPSTNTATTAATFTARVTLETGATLAVDGAPLNGTVATNWESARVNFAGTAGQNLGVGMTNLVLGTGSSYAYTRIYKPDGVELASFICYPNGDTCAANLASLPASGTYMMIVQPHLGGTGSFALHASTDLTGTLTVGTPATANVTRPGQNARFAFAGATGDLRQLSVTALSQSPATWVAFTIYKPNGAYFANAGGGAPFSYAIPALTDPGSYTIVIEPSGKGAATFNTTLAVVPR